MGVNVKLAGPSETSSTPPWLADTRTCDSSTLWRVPILWPTAMPMRALMGGGYHPGPGPGQARETSESPCKLLLSMAEWVKHEMATRWCAVLRRDHKAIRTRCRGSLDECDPHAIAGHPAVADRCVFCQRAHATAELEALAFADDKRTAAPPLSDRAPPPTLRDRDARRRDYIENTDYVPGEDW